MMCPAPSRLAASTGRRSPVVVQATVSGSPSLGIHTRQGASGAAIRSSWASLLLSFMPAPVLGHLDEDGLRAPAAPRTRRRRGQRLLFASIRSTVLGIRAERSQRFAEVGHRRRLPVPRALLDRWASALQQLEAPSQPSHLRALPTPRPAALRAPTPRWRPSDSRRVTGPPSRVTSADSSASSSARD